MPEQIVTVGLPPSVEDFTTEQLVGTVLGGSLPPDESGDLRPGATIEQQTEALKLLLQDAYRKGVEATCEAFAANFPEHPGATITVTWNAPVN